MATKNVLQKVCQLLKVSTTGTKPILQNRICSTINIDSKKKLQQDITNVIIEMLDDDSELANISRYIKKEYKVSISKIELSNFAEIWDAAKKNDYIYIEEFIQQNNISTKVLNLLKNTNNSKLTEFLS